MSASSVQWISAHIKPMDVEKLTLHSFMINDAYTIPPLVYSMHWAKQSLLAMTVYRSLVRTNGVQVSVGGDLKGQSHENFFKTETVGR